MALHCTTGLPGYICWAGNHSVAYAQLRAATAALNTKDGDEILEEMPVIGAGSIQPIAVMMGFFAHARSRVQTKRWCGMMNTLKTEVRKMAALTEPADRKRMLRKMGSTIYALHDLHTEIEDGFHDDFQLMYLCMAGLDLVPFKARRYSTEVAKACRNILKNGKIDTKTPLREMMETGMLEELERLYSGAANVPDSIKSRHKRKRDATKRKQDDKKSTKERSRSKGRKGKGKKPSGARSDRNDKTVLCGNGMECELKREGLCLKAHRQEELRPRQ